MTCEDEMRVMTVLGTRPEIIRLSLIIGKLDQYCEHILVHTGQNFDDNLSSIFFLGLGLRGPNHYLGVRGDTVGEELGKMLIEVEKVVLSEQPDRLLVLGDTNSGLAAIVAKKMGIPVFHMEAGNRCFDDRVPEEVNRRIIDHASTVLMPYTERSKQNLLREGVPHEMIYVTGNPIHEVIEHYWREIDGSQSLEAFGIEPREYFLATMHRAENVDQQARLEGILDGLQRLSGLFGYPVICSLHPRTKSKMDRFGLWVDPTRVVLSSPLGFADFIALEKNALCVITDSGTVQEECSIFGVPSVTIRDVTERPETIECGSNVLAGVSPDLLLKAVEVTVNERCGWEAPWGYLERNVSSKVVKIVLGYLRDSR